MRLGWEWRLRFLAAVISFTILRETEEGNKSGRERAFKWAGNAEGSPSSPSLCWALPWSQTAFTRLRADERLTCARRRLWGKIAALLPPSHLLGETSFIARMSNQLIYSVWGIFLSTSFFFLVSVSPVKKPAEFSSPEAEGTFSVSLIDLWITFMFQDVH